MNLAKLLAMSVSKNATISTFTASNLDNAVRMGISGNSLCVTISDRLTVIDITDPADMSEAGTLSNTTYLTGSRAIGFHGNYALIAAATDGYIVAIDISDPSTMSVDGTRSITTARGIAIVGDYLWTTGHSDIFFKENISSLPTITNDDSFTATSGTYDDGLFDTAASVNTRVFALASSESRILRYTQATPITTPSSNAEIGITSSDSRVYTDPDNDGYVFVIRDTKNISIYDSSLNPVDLITLTLQPLAIAFGGGDYMYVLDAQNINRVNISTLNNIYLDGIYRKRSIYGGKDIALDGTTIYVIKDGSVIALDLTKMF